MGYRCDVRVATTAKGFKKIKELAIEYYEKMVRSHPVVREDADSITVRANGENILYDKRPWLVDAIKVYATTRDDKFVLFGWDDIKWMGYPFDTIESMQKAFDDCGEPVHLVAIGEDGATEDQDWNCESSVYDDLPIVDTMRDWDFSDEWDFVEGV